MANMTTKPDSRGPVGLLALPSELRLQIYAHVLVDRHEARQITFKHRPHLTCSFAAVKEPPLLFVSHQVRAEALPEFYGRNTFHYAKLSALAYWLVRLTPEKLAMIRQIRGFQLPCEVRMDQDLYDARKEAWQVERSLALAGVKLQPGVLRMPAKCRVTGKCVVWWVSCNSFVLVGTRADGGSTEVVRKVDASRYLKRKQDAQTALQSDVIEAMWRAVAASGRCRCQACAPSVAKTPAAAKKTSPPSGASIGS
ncbi:hypothetical protein B0A55_08277 [Friedmanniomyces simplex]|uniref:F-box domain-containing protein n=1 Tax=Friedmanniomyces simplex TaxID=329884 RepID=A0A4V6WKW5_9PEZI|nr:hypothetical protein B0A55_08448 [Friedmanniomyces simplex]TKA66736.1 hypothetical protein B0A55_08277 [Friedmanniomyces simplex]